MSEGRGSALALLFDLLGRRWALRILWELRDGPRSSRVLAARCGGISPTVLHRRLRDLRDAGLVEHEVHRGYALSTGGAGLVATLRLMKEWAARWSRGKAMVKSRSS